MTTEIKTTENGATLRTTGCVTLRTWINFEGHTRYSVYSPTCALRLLRDRDAAEERYAAAIAKEAAFRADHGATPTEDEIVCLELAHLIATTPERGRRELVKAYITLPRTITSACARMGWTSGCVPTEAGAALLEI
jgi:hypothetical protein